MYSQVLLCLVSDKKKIDSLKHIINLEKDSHNKASLLLSLSKFTQNTSIKESEENALKAVELINLDNDKDLLSQIYFQLAYLNYKEQKDNKAILYFNKLDSILKPTNTINEVFIKSKLYRAQISKFTFTIEGLKRGKEYLTEMLAHSKNTNNKKYEHLSYYQFGDWYTTYAEVENEKENIDTARVYFDKALKYFKKN